MKWKKLFKKDSVHNELKDIFPTYTDENVKWACNRIVKGKRIGFLYPDEYKRYILNNLHIIKEDLAEGSPVVFFWNENLTSGGLISADQNYPIFSARLISDEKKWITSIRVPRLFKQILSAKNKIDKYHIIHDVELQLQMDMNLIKHEHLHHSEQILNRTRLGNDTLNKQLKVIEGKQGKSNTNNFSRWEFFDMIIERLKLENKEGYSIGQIFEESKYNDRFDNSSKSADQMYYSQLTTINKKTAIYRKGGNLGNKETINDFLKNHSFKDLKNWVKKQKRHCKKNNLPYDIIPVKFFMEYNKDYNAAPIIL